MELETISNTKPEQSGATGGSGAAGLDTPNFCDGKPAERFRKPHVKACGHDDFMAGLLRQNKTACKELAGMLGIGPNGHADPREMEGMLSDYADPNESSEEIVRRIRDDAGGCD